MSYNVSRRRDSFAPHVVAKREGTVLPAAAARMAGGRGNRALFHVRSSGRGPGAVIQTVGVSYHGTEVMYSWACYQHASGGAGRDRGADRQAGRASSGHGGWH